MSVVLNVERAAWRAHVRATLDGYGGAVIPVIKGNGYGLRRHLLAEEALRLGLDPIAVGTVHELDGDLPARHRSIVVLTPTLDAHLDGVPENVALTVGSMAQLRHVADRASANPVVIKLRSSMRRHGFEPDDLPRATHRAEGPLAYAVHPPISGDDEAHVREIERWLPALDPAVPVQVSHLGAEAFARLCERHHERAFAIRLGTRLWHGDKSTMQLRAD